MKVVILGNSGSGKTTMAGRLVERHGLALLDLDTIAWSAPGERKRFSESIGDLQAFVNDHASGWVIEGSYGDLAEAALAHCTELRFLNPGIAACIANCEARPFEPHKYASPEEQDANLDMLKDWVRQYETRADTYGLAYHRRVYASFDGEKREYTDPGDMT